MAQLSLPMLTVYTGPRIVAGDVVEACKQYRDAVRMCWSLRVRNRMAKTAYAAEIGCYPSHLSGYVSEQEGRRQLPAEFVAAFEVACGNRCITQWLAAQANLTILEQFITARAA
jgi:hypothetical protein